jgi:acyl carrier protein
MSDDVDERLRKVIAEHLGVDESFVVPGASVMGDLGADSLDAVELTMAIEEVFACEISDSECEKLLTVQDVVDLLRKKING